MTKASTDRYQEIGIAESIDDVISGLKCLLADVFANLLGNAKYYEFRGCYHRQ
jgi:hypothetical protein